MKRLTPILFLICFTWAARAELNVRSNAVFGRFCSSYFGLHHVGDYEDGARYLYWWTNNIHCYENYRSGGSTAEANQNRLEREGIAQWANGSQYWLEIHVDNNGGYDTNATRSNLLDTLKAPGLLYNGTDYTNEGGWAESHSGQMNFIIGGSIPILGHFTTASDGDVRNGAALALAAQSNLCSIDMFHFLNTTAGWSNDIQSGANLRQTPDGEHPGPPGGFGMAVGALNSQIDTNINTCILNFQAAAIVSTNHCVVSGVSLSGNSLSFNWHADRHSMPFDMPDGTITNDCSNAFVMAPAFSNAFYEVICFTNVPAGAWAFIEDGSNIVTFTSSGPTANISLNLFSITKGSVWAQRKELLGRIRDKRFVNRVTLVEGGGGNHIGEAGYNNDSGGWWNLNASQRGDTLIADLATNIAALNTFDGLIWSAATPTNHADGLVPVAQRFAPFHL